LALSGACAGFLLHNWHPARIVMGDVGSQAIGFFIACLPFLTPVARRGEAILIVAIALSFCLIDCTLTLLRRLARGERVWEGHREHIYQRLIRTGLRHDQVAGWVVIAGLPASALGVAGFRLGRPALEWAALGVGLAMFVAHLARTLKRERG
jgi:UDP-N-acetylmuramyl pentapeptide phosphotransferase/UDP-N-acetylglucosamine-1-phosphate transferase